ncbi:MAG: IMP dehydrogenase, partial [Planctomycetota bacterium]
AGANAIKIGVGSGSICITRIVTGFGVPQLSAILECAHVAQQKGIPLIADGGIRNSGDLSKALAAGAQAVMIGSLLAGTTESPGKIIQRKGRRYKIIRGMASLGATMNREDATEELEQVVPEGVEAAVPYRGSVQEILQQLVGGFRSSMSYAGASTLEEFQQYTEFVPITSASLTESKPHDVEFLSS